MFLLDTDTIIYSLKGNDSVVSNLKAHQRDPLKISVISLMELYYGAYKSEKTNANLAKVRRIENEPNAENNVKCGRPRCSFYQLC